MESDPWVERRLTASLARKFDRGDKRVLIGIGDDGAVVRTTSRTVVTCDPVVEGVHFEGSTPPHLIGRKAVNRNLSDLAAMGARPTFLVVSILFPGWLDPAGRQQLFRGIRDAARSADCTVVGGDVARTEGLLVVTVTALGEAPRRPLTRAGLRVGDSVHVS